MAAKQTKQTGRPKGAKTQDRPTQVVDASRCVRCGSTERDPYQKIRELERGGITDDGREYTHVVWRKTSCRSCGQARVDRTYEKRQS